MFVVCVWHAALWVFLAVPVTHQVVVVVVVGGV